MENQMIFVRMATIEDAKYIDEIIEETASSALIRGSGISKRTAESLLAKMSDGKAVIALTSTGTWVGFAYLEYWDGDFVSNSGLIVAPKFRNSGVAKSIKYKIFRMSRILYPTAKIFSITSGAAMMSMNTQLGYQPVTYAEITPDPKFWEGCKSCVNYKILNGKNRSNCLCTAMLFKARLNELEAQLTPKLTFNVTSNNHS